MNKSIFFSAAALAVLLAGPAPAQTALQALEELPEALAHMPGDPGTGESGVRIRRGTGFTVAEATETPSVTSTRSSFYASTGRAVQVDELLEAAPTSAAPRIIIINNNRSRSRYRPRY